MKPIFIVLLITSILIISGCSYMHHKNTLEASQTIPLKSGQEILNEVESGVFLSEDSRFIVVEESLNPELTDPVTLNLAGGIAWNCRCPDGSPQYCWVTQSGGGYNCEGYCNSTAGYCTWVRRGYTEYP